MPGSISSEEHSRVTMDEAAAAAEIEVPSYFICPISMQLMKDPITLCTGITYDRQSIEKWLYVCGKNTCPATGKLLHNRDLTPNHTLRRLIQGWCAANTSSAIHPIPARSPQIESSRVHKLLQRILHSPPLQVFGALSELRGLAGEREPNRRCIAAAGASEVLISVIESFYTEIEHRGLHCSFDGAKACEEALAILCDLSVGTADLTADDEDKIACNWKCVASMAWILKRGTSQARFRTVMLLHNMVVRRIADEEFLRKVIREDLVEGLLELLTGEVCYKATISDLEILIVFCRSSRTNRMRAIEAGAVHVLIHSLPETRGRSSCERMLNLLEVLCGCAEGRAAIIGHAMGIAAVSNCILSVSDVATEKAVRILCSLCKFNPNPRVLQEMAQVGALMKLLMVLQFQCTSKTKQKATQVLRYNERLWRKSHCIPLHLLTVYPSDQ